MTETQTAAELVEYMAKALVSEPDAVQIRVLANEQTLELETAEADRGRVIGRQGRVAKAMRAVLAASRVGATWRLEIID
ncbi:hypothetical protein MYXO_02906 [Myxococcaceae bacterium]|nr:hypothetical protein MYXO_02906 [Myxococcaceae bacterium]